jgi:hypothetical protein
LPNFAYACGSPLNENAQYTTKSTVCTGIVAHMIAVSVSSVVNEQHPGMPKLQAARDRQVQLTLGEVLFGFLF